MRTQLPEKISSIEEAKTFLSELIKNNETFHPEDDAHEIFFETMEVQPTWWQANQLNCLMDDIYNLKGNDGRHNNLAFCPCEFILNNTTFNHG